MAIISCNRCGNEFGVPEGMEQNDIQCPECHALANISSPTPMPSTQARRAPGLSPGALALSPMGMGGGIFTVMTPHGQTIPNLSASQIMQLLQQGQLTLHCMAQPAGAPGWVQLSQLPEFAAAMLTPAPIPAEPYSMPSPQPQVQQVHIHNAAPPPNQTAENGIAVAGFVMGLLSAFLFWVPCLGTLFPLLGLIFSGVGISNAKKLDRNGKGRGLAVTGLVLSIITLIISVVITVLMILAEEF